MHGERGVVAAFSDPSRAARAIEQLRASGYREVRARMPAPYREVMSALGRPPSQLGGLTLCGAVLGFAAGALLCVMAATPFPLPLGGKPVLALPAMAVVACELGLLGGAVALHAALTVATAVGRRRRPVPLEDARFSLDRVGLFVPGEPEAAERVLRQCGAEEVSRVEA